MGLLATDGLETLTYQESKKYQKLLKKIGLYQLANLLKKCLQESKEFKRSPKFGFEIEGHLLNNTSENPSKPNYQLGLDKTYLTETKDKKFEITDEYGRWMLELIPNFPMEDFLYSGNMLAYTKYIYKKMELLMKPGHRFLSYSVPPKLGTEFMLNYLEPGKSSEEIAELNKASNSKYMRDEIINTHPRFPTFTQNVRLRRGEKPKVRAPIFQDKHTQMNEPFSNNEKAGEIDLDAFTFGMGLCSLQCTFGVTNFSEARWLYDQFHIFTPLFVGIS